MKKMILILCMLILMGSTNCSKNTELEFDPLTTIIQKLIKKGTSDNSGG